MKQVRVCGSLPVLAPGSESLDAYGVLLRWIRHGSVYAGSQWGYSRIGQSNYACLDALRRATVGAYCPKIAGRRRSALRKGADWCYLLVAPLGQCTLPKY